MRSAPLRALAVSFFLAGTVAACVPAEPGEGMAAGGRSGGAASGGAGAPATGGSPGTGGTSATGGNPGPIGTGGTTGGGGTNGSGGTTGSGGLQGTGGGAGRGGAGAIGAGGTGGGSGTGGATSSGGISGGSGGAGTASGGNGGSGAPAAPSGEDDGADCTIVGLPDSAALTANAKFPDPFKKLDGSRISTKAEWRCRREEIRKLAEKFAYGTKPPKAAMVTGTVSNSSITVKVTDNSKSTMFSAQIVLPGSGSPPYPAIIVLGGASFGAPLDSGVIKGEGIALINYDQYVVGKEGTGRANKQGAFYD